MQKIIFIKAHTFNRFKRNVGHITRVREDIAEELVKKGVAKIYMGHFPPIQKIKISLNELKTYKDGKDRK